MIKVYDNEKEYFWRHQWRLLCALHYPCSRLSTHCSNQKLAVWTRGHADNMWQWDLRTTKIVKLELRKRDTRKSPPPHGEVHFKFMSLTTKDITIRFFESQTTLLVDRIPLHDNTLSFGCHSLSSHQRGNDINTGSCLLNFPIINPISLHKALSSQSNWYTAPTRQIQSCFSIPINSESTRSSSISHSMRFLMPPTSEHWRRPLILPICGWSRRPVRTRCVCLCEFQRSSLCSYKEASMIAEWIGRAFNWPFVTLAPWIR